MHRRWTMAVADLVQDHGSAQVRFQVRGESMLPTLRPGDQVLVEPAPIEALRPGDLILVHREGQPILHRYLGTRIQSGRRFLLTAGDHRWYTDPPCPEQAFQGRVVAAFRQGQALPVPAGRWPVWRHRLRAAIGGAGHRLRSWLPVLLALLFVLAWGGTSRAAVTLVSFATAWDGNDLRVTWTTASEVDSLGFYVWRSDREDGQYSRVSDLIPASGDIAGGTYSWRDPDGTANASFYYKLEGISAGGSGSFWGPIPASGAQPTNTATATATATATSTATPAPTSTATATPAASATLTPTASGTPTRLPTIPPTRTATPTRRASPTPAPRQSPAARYAAPSPTPPATATPAAVALLATLPVGTDTSKPTDTATPAPVAEPSATAIPVPSPTIATYPSPTVVAMSAAPSGGAAPQTEAPPPSQEELASARHRLTWALVGIGGVIASGLLLALLALIVFALHRWGVLRPG